MTKEEIIEFATRLQELADSQVDSGLKNALSGAVWDIEDGRFTEAVAVLTDVRAYLRWVSSMLPWRDVTAARVSEALVYARGLAKLPR